MWAQFYNQHSPDLLHEEFLFVGKKDDEIIKSSHRFYTTEGVNSTELVKWLNSCLEKMGVQDA